MYWKHTIQQNGFTKAMIVAFLCLSFVIAGTAQAADPKPTVRDDSYSARFVSQTVADPVTIEAGETKEVAITFRNVGTATWDANTARYISAYTMEPRYRVSPFIGGKQTARIPGVVQPGQDGILTLKLTAPEKTGEYLEQFYLAAENHTWVKGSYFFLKINVVPATKPASSPQISIEKEETPETVESTHAASIIGQNKREVFVKGAEQVKLVVLYKNQGKEDWKNVSMRVSQPTSLATLSGKRLTYADSTWLGDSLVRTISAIPAGKTGKETIYFRAPHEKGEYTATFFLAADGTEIEGSSASVHVHVTENAPLNYQAPTFDTKVPSVVQKQYRLAEEARVRVGLITDKNRVEFLSQEDDYVVFDGTREKGTLPKGEKALLKEAGGIFEFVSDDLTFKTFDYIRLEPKHEVRAEFQIPSGLRDRSIAWVGPSNFLNYKGAMELRKGEIDNDLYVVNDVLMEDYVAGISETGHTVHIEAVKANLIAARTYAYISKGKYPFFDVLGSTYDQLYLGADVATYLKNVPIAAAATRGQVVTYAGEVVTTPYFGNSNGTTRAWHTVWGGSVKPWLVSVVAKYDAGRSRFGHGVGMSQRDAALRAKNDGWTAEQLLRHYYTGTSVETLYR